MRYAQVINQRVVNVIEWDGVSGLHDERAEVEGEVLPPFVPFPQSIDGELVPGEKAQMGDHFVNGAFVTPIVEVHAPPHAELVQQAKAATRIQRQPIISVLDGLQVSAIAKGDQARAVVIETAKQGLRDITDLDLSACETFEAMRLAVKARYLQLAGALPADVRKAFSEALS